MKYVTRDCWNCDGLSDVGFRQCNACVKPEQELDLIIFKNRLFTKHHYLKQNKFEVVPFFVDCLLRQVEGNVLAAYDIKDASVKIVSEEDGFQPVYVLNIPHLDKNYLELMKLREQFEARDFSDNLLKTWIKEHGVLDYLLTDAKIQEININPPEFQSPFRILHEDFGECLTNIYPSIDFLNYLATYLKIESGRPLNKAQPQLDAELFVENQRARVEAVVEPFSVHGIGYSIRKHREFPWTLPLFIKNKAVSPLFAGLMSFVITHGRTFLVAGPRGSGKTSILGALILEILPRYRIITIEDTQELAVDYYKQLGYDLLALKVRSALMETGMELPFDIGLRTSLRLGDSCLILGEVRSKEAKVLYEAMRVGAMSNVVAGTIHADNPYGVYDRIVNDLQVPKGSFKVTDLIIIVNQIKTATGLSRVRRVTSVSEVLKDWEQEPKFQELMYYDPKKDELVPTDVLLKGKSETIKRILAVTKGYESYDSALKDVFLRAWAKQKYVEILSQLPEKLEADVSLRVNLLFVELFEKNRPLENSRNEEKFKKEFEAELKSLLKK